MNWKLVTTIIVALFTVQCRESSAQWWHSEDIVKTQDYAVPLAAQAGTNYRSSIYLGGSGASLWSVMGPDRLEEQPAAAEIIGTRKVYFQGYGPPSTRITDCDALLWGNTPTYAGSQPHTFAYIQWLDGTSSPDDPEFSGTNNFVHGVGFCAAFYKTYTFNGFGPYYPGARVHTAAKTTILGPLAEAYATVEIGK